MYLLERLPLQEAIYVSFYLLEVKRKNPCSALFMFGIPHMVEWLILAWSNIVYLMNFVCVCASAMQATDKSPRGKHTLAVRKK